MGTISEETKMNGDNYAIPEEMQENEDEGEDTGRRGFMIKVISLDNMEPLKKIIIKTELNGKSIGKSEEITVENKEVPINWETFYDITEVTENIVDELVSNPLVFTVLCDSILPPAEEEAVSPKKSIKSKKDKGKGSKSPSEKGKSVKDHSITNESKKTVKSTTSKSISSATTEVFPVLGVGNLDLLPLLLEREKIVEELVISPTTEKKGSENIAWENLPKLKILVSTAGHIIEEVTEVASNILSFTLESLYNVSPDCNEDVQVATISPSSQQIIKFKNGSLLLDDSSWVSNRKKWFSLNDLQGSGALSPHKVLDNISNLLNTMDDEVTDDTVLDKPRILWNQLHRSFLNIPTQDSFKEKIVQYNCWPMEILIPSSSGKSEGKKKAGKDSEQTINHYITFLDMSRLIYPGERSVRLASQLYTYTEDAMKMRFGSSHILFDEVSAPPDVQDIASNTSPSKKGTKPESPKSKKDSKKGSKKGSVKSKDLKKQKEAKVEEVIAEEPVEVKEPEPVFNDEGEPLFIIIEVELRKPLVERRQEEQTLESIYKIVPKREPLTCQQLETINATKLYEDCIKCLIHNVHDEYQIFFNINESHKNSSKNFLLHLQVTGAYSKMLESMKEAISVHVKNTVGSADTWEKMKYECQDILTSLYQEMANKMYVIVNSIPDPGLDKYEPEITCDDLQYYGSEAFEEGDFNKAHDYLLQRLERSEKADPQVWVDFAGFCKKRLEFEKAEECAKEAVSLDPRHTNTLLFHGLLSWLTEDFDVAEMFLLSVVGFTPSCLEGWVALHMLHRQMGKQKEARVELLNAKECIKEFPPPVEGKSHLYWSAGMAERDRVYLLTAVKLLDLAFPEFAEVALSYDLLLHGRTFSYLYYLAVSHYQQGRYTNCITHLQEALKIHWEDDMLWALKGHSLYKLDKLEEAKEAYNVAINFKNEEDQHLINLRLAKILAKEGDHQRARELYLIICKDSPTPLSWLGLGISAFIEDDMEEAELALSEANLMDCKIGEVWGYLALVNLMLGRPLIFNRCIVEAFKYGLEDQALIERIDSLIKLVQPLDN